MTWRKRNPEPKVIVLHPDGPGHHDLTSAEWRLIERLATKRNKTPEHIASILIRIGINAIITNTFDKSRDPTLPEV